MRILEITYKQIGDDFFLIYVNHQILNMFDLLTLINHRYKAHLFENIKCEYISTVFDLDKYNLKELKTKSSLLRFFTIKDVKEFKQRLEAIFIINKFNEVKKENTLEDFIKYL